MIATNTSFASPIQYRSGLLEQWIGEYARTWGISTNESAKRLTALAASGLHADHHGMLEAFANALGGHSSFVKACHDVRVALDAANRAREEMGLEPLQGEERGRFVQRSIEEMTNRQRQRRTKIRTAE